MSKLGKGTVFKMDNTTIGNVTNINGPTGSRDIVDKTTMDADKYKEILGGLRDGGNFTFTLHYEASHWGDFFDAYESDSASSFEIAFPDDAGKITFDGLVQELPVEASAEEIITCNLTVAIKGETLDFTENP